LVLGYPTVGILLEAEGDCGGELIRKESGDDRKIRQRTHVDDHRGERLVTLVTGPRVEPYHEICDVRSETLERGAHDIFDGDVVAGVNSREPGSFAHGMTDVVELTELVSELDDPEQQEDEQRGEYGELN
jgi:hypothetical protein